MTRNLKSCNFRHISNLIQEKAFINGKWVESFENKKIGVLNPASQKIIAYVPDLNEDQINSSISFAQEAFFRWRNFTGKERGKILTKWLELINQNKDKLAQLITIENGKTIKESHAEINSAANFFEWFSSESYKINGDILTSPDPKKKMFVFKEPVGVCSFITPWNFPCSMIARKVAPALAAGCTCVLKPSEETPLSALALAQLGQAAGLPEGVFNVVTCSHTSVTTSIGKLLCQHPLISKVSFTGSTRTGKILLGHCADGVKRVSMELGGNAPFIIFPSAHLKNALDGLIAAKFRCAGQTCVCANRILVHETVYEEFRQMLLQKLPTMPVGPGNDPLTQIGPLINKDAADKVEGLLEDAVSNGAKISYGGKRLGETFIEPTLVESLNPHMRLWTEEIFGPIASLIKFKDEDEAVAIANSTPYGLASYFYSRDIQQIWRVKSSLKFGLVGINEGIISAVEAPFGGFKMSGIGVEGSKYGIDEYLLKKYVCWTI